MSNLVITIARTYGSNGRAVGKALAKELGVNIYDRNILIGASEDSGNFDGFFGLNDEKVRLDDNLFKLQSEKIKALAKDESCVIVGRCADQVLKDHDNLVKVFIHASPKYCVKTIMKMYGVSPSEAEKLISQADRERSTYYTHYTGKEWNDFSNYDLCLNAASIGIDGCVKMIKDFIEVRSSRG